MNYKSSLIDTFAQRPYLLYDGPMETRIEYNTSLILDKEMSIFTLMYSEEGKKALCDLYTRDSLIALKYNIPIILNAPTYRASPAHCRRLGYNAADSVKVINKDCIEFVKTIRDELSPAADQIFVTAPIGPERAGYSPELSFTIQEACKYHSQQANAIAEVGVDIISIAAMPGAIETIGCAKAVASTGLPYSVGVILTKQGTLLDGKSFAELIHEIDSTVSPKPLFYVISCTHPTTAQKALQSYDSAFHRILGIKANGSSKSPTELLALNKAEADEADLFADELFELGKEHQFKIYGGCCGTDHRHLAALAKKLSSQAVELAI